MTGHREPGAPLSATTVRLLEASRAIAPGGVAPADLVPLMRLPASATPDPGQLDEGLGRLLAALDLFEEATTRILIPDCQIYLLGADTVAYLIDLVFGRQDELQAIQDRLGILHMIGLVYYLPCAKKFGYDPLRYSQVRISAWGRVAVAECAPTCSSFNDPGLQKLADLIAGQKLLYRSLVAAASSRTRPLDLAHIHVLNRRVALPIVT